MHLMKPFFQIAHFPGFHRKTSSLDGSDDPVLTSPAATSAEVLHRKYSGMSRTMTSERDLLKHLPDDAEVAQVGQEQVG